MFIFQAAFLLVIDSAKGKGCKQMINSCHPTKTSWWLNQPLWKICSSNWIISPGFEVIITNTWKHPPPRDDCTEVALQIYRKRSISTIKSPFADKLLVNKVKTPLNLSTLRIRLYVLSKGFPLQSYSREVSGFLGVNIQIPFLQKQIMYQTCWPTFGCAVEFGRSHFSPPRAANHKEVGRWNKTPKLNNFGESVRYYNLPNCVFKEKNTLKPIHLLKHRENCFQPKRNIWNTTLVKSVNFPVIFWVKIRQMKPPPR